MKVVLVTGSRYWNDEAPIRKALEGAELLIVGDCPTGADLIALKVAREDDCIVALYKADWAKYGDRRIGNPAGPERNGKMVARLYEEHSAGMDCKLAGFPMPGSKGTVDCMNQVLALMPWLK